jgi:hypothetical protein
MQRYELRHISGNGGSVMLRNRDELDCLLKREFAEGARWPIDRPSLTALTHMGLTIEQIARYFSVEPAEVQALLNNSK